MHFTLRIVLLNCLFLASNSASSEGLLHDGYYFGAGVTGTFIQPRPNNSQAEVTEDEDFGYRIYAGYIDDSGFGGEIEYHDMGAAELSVPFTDVNGTVDYSFVGLAGVYQAPVAKETDGYLKLGVGQLDTKGNGIEREQIHDTQVYYAAGLRHYLTPEYAITGEFARYDTDAASMSLNLEMRLAYDFFVLPKSVEEVTREKVKTNPVPEARAQSRLMLPQPQQFNPSYPQPHYVPPRLGEYSY